MADIEWITLNTTAGTGDSAVTWSVPAWTGSTDRSVKLTVAVPGTMLSDTVTVTQKGIVQPTADGQFYVIVKDVNRYRTATISVNTTIHTMSHKIEYSTDGYKWTTDRLLRITDEYIGIPVFIRILGTKQDDSPYLGFANINSAEIGGSLKSLYVDEEPLPPETAYHHLMSPLSQIISRITDVHNLTVDTLCNYENFKRYPGAGSPLFPDTLNTVDRRADYDYMFSQCSALTGPVVMPSSISGNCSMFRMFEKCTAMTEPPVLPEEITGDLDMHSTFYLCSSLSAAPSFPLVVSGNFSAIECFSANDSLTEVPSLPGTVGGDFDASDMFAVCVSLTEAPSLPGTVGGNFNAFCMFRKCTSLTGAPSLPTTVGGNFDVTGMFYGCTSLTGAPSLPATIEGDFIANGMFYDCTSLTDAPSLPGNIGGGIDTSEMFHNCSSLTGASINFPLSSVSAATYMFTGVNPTGILKVRSDETMSDDDIRTKVDLPSGWTIQRVL